MCGINGILRLDPGAPPIDREELLRTRDAMTSRGPDGAGLWLSDDGRIGLGHRRLAILDLSDAAAQPMATPDGRFHIVVNGEIYNFPELRRELEADGHRFRSTGDTEVVLALYERHGRSALGRLRGMYALALWDDTAKTLLLARDPLGIKPLYYAAGEADETGDAANVLRFASSVKALEAGGAVSREVDPAGLAGFLLWGSVPEPHTIRRAVRAVPAGTSIRIQSGRPPEPPVPTEPRMDGAGTASWTEAIEESVRCHLVSDVPVAVFLSAGLDSATLAALATRHLPEPPATFTMRFEPTLGTAHDEGPAAAEIARALGTHHVERTVGRSEFRDLWESALSAMDQPSIDGFNTFLVSRAAAEAGLKVVLSGLGGDELLGSYPSFRQVPRLRRWARTAARVPGAAATWAGLSRRLVPGRPKLPGLLGYGASLAGAYFLRRGLFLPDELPALLGAERAAAALAAYDPVADAERIAPPTAEAAEAAEAADPWTAVQAFETGLYLRNQLLRDADWASMAHSIELRVPFVDAWLRRRASPTAWHEARSGSKGAVLRRVAPELPAALWRRPKTGFYIPVMDWLDDEAPRGPVAGRPGRAMGPDSRRLALRVLEEQGIELPGDAR